MAAIRPLLAPLQPSSLRSLSGPVSPVTLQSKLRSQIHSPPLPSPRSIPSSPAFSLRSKALEGPSRPMPWIWSCHKCHTRYPLGATRRCLHDGHYFCGGITVDKVTDKTKKHRACASEFDYISWEEYGKWKTRVAKVQSKNDLNQHCEYRCDFPSACHWKSRNTPKKNANFGFLDPKSLGTEPAVTASEPAKNSMPTLKKTSLYIDRIVKAAEKHTTQLTTLLSTIDEEKNFSSLASNISSPTNAPPKLPELSSLNGLGLSFPSMDFPLFAQTSDDGPKDIELSDATPDTITPDLSVSVMTAEVEDIDMTDWLSDDPSTSSPPISPTSTIGLGNVNSNLNLDPGHGPQASLADDEDEDNDSPVSPPRRNAWDWTAGDIGIALGSPTKPVWEEIWDEPMEDETEREWEKELGLSERRLSI